MLNSDCSRFSPVFKTVRETSMINLEIYKAPINKALINLLSMDWNLIQVRKEKNHPWTMSFVDIWMVIFNLPGLSPEGLERGGPSGWASSTTLGLAHEPRRTLIMSAM